MPDAGHVAKIVIAGAGQAGGRAAEALRAKGFRGAITLLGAEPHHPYERPQLSKELLSEKDKDVAFIKAASDWQQVLGIDVITGARVQGCDFEQQRVTLADGRTFAYDRLLIATGTEPRRLPEGEANDACIHYLRNIEDALRLRSPLHERARVVVIGGGVIGLEAAAAAAKLDCAVTVVEVADRLLARAFPKLISDVVAAKHRAHGVDFVFGVTVTAITPRGVRLTNGQEIDADVILVGIGVDVAQGIASLPALASPGGVKIDKAGRTAAPNVFCAGDVAVQWSAWHDNHMRIETWANAQNQAICVAGNMIGEARDYLDAPWFWSDQYDLNIQVVGNTQGGELAMRGDPASGRFSLASLRDGELIGAISINQAKDMASFRRLATARAKLTQAEIESPTFDLRRALKT